MLALRRVDPTDHAVDPEHPLIDLSAFDHVTSPTADWGREEPSAQVLDPDIQIATASNCRSR